MPRNYKKKRVGQLAAGYSQEDLEAAVRAVKEN
jgi:hypothetical protein